MDFNEVLNVEVFCLKTQILNVERPNSHINKFCILKFTLFFVCAFSAILVCYTSECTKQNSIKYRTCFFYIYHNLICISVVSM